MSFSRKLQNGRSILRLGSGRSFTAEMLRQGMPPPRSDSRTWVRFKPMALPYLYYPVYHGSDPASSPSPRGAPVPFPGFFNVICQLPDKHVGPNLRSCHCVFWSHFTEYYSLIPRSCVSASLPVERCCAGWQPVTGRISPNVYLSRDGRQPDSRLKPDTARYSRELLIVYSHPSPKLLRIAPR
jgi:hypothetical protein